MAAENDESVALDRLRSGGQEDLAAIYEANRPRLRRMVELRIDPRLRQRIDASDVLQEGFVDISQRLGSYLDEPTLPVFVWMRFLVSQKLAAIQRWHFQRQKRDPRREAPAPLPVANKFDSQQLAREFSASLTSPSEAFQRDESMKRLQQSLEQMDSTDREILVLRHFEELTNTEAAAELGLSTAAASKRYIRALARLKQAIA